MSAFHRRQLHTLSSKLVASCYCSIYPVAMSHITVVTSIPRSMPGHVSPCFCYIYSIFFLLHCMVSPCYCYIYLVAGVHVVIVTSIPLQEFTLLLLHLSRCWCSPCYCYIYPVVGVHFVTYIPLLVVTLLLLHLSRCRPGLKAVRDRLLALERLR